MRSTWDKDLPIIWQLRDLVGVKLIHWGMMLMSPTAEGTELLQLWSDWLGDAADRGDRP